MGFVSYFYYCYFSEVSDNRNVAVVVKVRKGGRANERGTFKKVGTRTRISISNINDKKNVRCMYSYNVPHLYSVYVEKRKRIAVRVGE